MTIRIPKSALLFLALLVALFVGAAAGYASAPDKKISSHDDQHLVLNWGGDWEDRIQAVHVMIDNRMYRCSLVTHQNGNGGQLSHDCDWDHPIPR
jgi:hypothetical protein